MISQTFSLMGAMYEAIGPGLLFVAVLPFSIVGLVWVVRSGLHRAHEEE